MPCRYYLPERDGREPVPWCRAWRDKLTAACPFLGKGRCDEIEDDGAPL
jgi:hypothetical protein